MPGERSASLCNCEQRVVRVLSCSTSFIRAVSYASFTFVAHKDNTIAAEACDTRVRKLIHFKHVPTGLLVITEFCPVPGTGSTGYD
jgi:hypothetical protein